MFLTYQIPLIIIFIAGMNTLTDNKEIDVSRNHTLFQNITRLENTNNTIDVNTKLTDQHYETKNNYILFVICALIN